MARSASCLKDLVRITRVELYVFSPGLGSCRTPDTNAHFHTTPGAADLAEAIRWVHSMHWSDFVEVGA